MSASSTGSIRILSGPIRSGKTTRLRRFCDGRSDVAGVLTPDDGQGRSMILLGSGTEIPFEVTGPTTEPAVEVGRFTFFQAAFDRGIRHLREAVQAQVPVVILDEVGKLELRGLGFGPVVQELIDACQSGAYRGTLVLVVREELLTQVPDHFGIRAWEPFLAE